MATLRTTIGAAAVGLALLLAACGDDGDSTIEGDLDSTTTTTAAEGSSTTAAPSDDDDLDPFATATSLVDVPDELPDGRYFGYITTLVAGDGGVSGQFDLAELLTGGAAIAAATEAGEEPLDFYIKNDNEKLRPIVLADDATVRDIDYDDCCDPKPSTPTQFVTDRDAADEDGTPVAIVVEDGTVTALEEVYFP